jgi:nitroimidazol reductase NimA-like FMN-containing flavoprotein (pyridoxamine 5'-phosphate oxidase superfamily)
MEVLPVSECLELLAGEEVGRLGVIVSGRPEIFPVNYVVDGNGILFRTAEGTKLDAALQGAVVFEVDHLDRATRSGWSVIVHGRAAVYTQFDSAAMRRASNLWWDTPKAHLLRITPDVIGGRRLRPAPS